MSAKVDSLARPSEDKERTLIAKIRDLENQLREKEGLLRTRDGQLQELSAEMSVLVEGITRIRRDRERMSSEIERLTSALKEKKILLAKAEMAEWRSIGRQNLRNLWRRTLAMLASLMEKPEHSKG